MDTGRYEPMLTGLRRDHAGPSFFYYLDASFEETLRRHDTRIQRTEFGAEDMRRWYRHRDLLTTIPERVIPQSSTLAETVSAILCDSQLLTSVILRAEAAADRDLPSWLDLVQEVEPLFGPMPASLCTRGEQLAADRRLSFATGTTPSWGSAAQP